MNLHLLYVGIDGAAITMAVLVAARSWQLLPRHKNTWFITAIFIGVICYHLSTRQDYGPLIPDAYDADFGSLFPIMNLLRNATTAFFMLLVHSIFRDGSRIPRVFLLLFVLQIFLEEPLAWFMSPAWAAAHQSIIFVLYEVVPAAIQLLFVSAALYWLLSERNADLVESRLKVRAFILVIYVLQVVGSLGIERVVMGIDILPWQMLYPIHVALVVVGIMTSAAILFSLNSPLSIRFIDPTADKTPIAPSDTGTDDKVAPDLAKITHALETDHIYRTIGLSVSDLATHLSLPEYRLRALIHNQLGFRNFNALLHHYRIMEVSAALEDSTQNTVPILTLALSAGYQSINPFNRAFRESKGMTPTDYRRQSQNNNADSFKSTLNTLTDPTFE